MREIQNQNNNIHRLVYVNNRHLSTHTLDSYLSLPTNMDDNEARRISISREAEWLTIKKALTDNALKHVDDVLREEGLSEDVNARQELEGLIMRVSHGSRELKCLAYRK